MAPRPRVIRRRKPSKPRGLRLELDEMRQRAEQAEQAAADQHVAMVRQDHVHAEEVAAIHAKLDRVLAAWAEILKRAEK